MARALKNKLGVLEKVGSFFDRREKLQLAWVMAVALAAALFQALGVVSILPFVELVMNPDTAQENRWLNLAFTSLGFESAYSFTLFVGAVLLGILVVGNIVSALSDWLRIRFVWHKNHTLSAALLRTYLSLPYVYFLNKHSAELSKNVLFEVQQLTSRLFMPLLQIATKGVVVIILLVLLVLVNPVVALGAALMFGAAYLAVFFLLQKSLEARGRRRLEENTRRFTLAEEALSGIKDIKVLGREQHFFDRFARHSDQFARLQAWASVAVQLPRYFMEVVAFGGAMALILLFLALRQDSSQVISLVGFFAFAGYRLMPALQTVFQAASEIQFNMAVLDKISRDIRQEAQQQVLLGSGELPQNLLFQNEIRFEEISFSYPYAHEYALQNVVLKIPKGAFVGFVGPTGGGKTTLIDMLIGLLSPQKGGVKVDDVVLGESNIRNWQRTIGYVPQQIFLSDDTIARNVAFGLRDDRIDRIQLEKVCRIANLHDFIAGELPHGYDTVIGERGIRLSGGQRQRIGIARALYHNPEVLVLDEATNALDQVTEGSVLEAVRALAGEKTLIIVAHRLATVRDCNVIYFIEKGRISASGTYGQLVETNASFRDMTTMSE